MAELLVHDSRRAEKINVLRTALSNGRARGVVLSPIDTPPEAQPRRTDAATIISIVRDAGGEAWFDPATYGALSAGANRFDIYDGWTLWASGRSQVQADLLENVRRAIAVQHSLGVTPIAPTISVSSPDGRQAETAQAMAQRALGEEADTFLSIVGPSSFWTSGAALDAYIGALVQMRPSGWYIAVNRDDLSYPARPLDPLEVAGISRTVRSLSLRGDVVIAAFGDFAGLPAAAAGASRIGTGGDLKQRCCANASFRTSPGVRRASLRVTHRGLLASLKRQEADRLEAGDAALSGGLVPGPLPPADRNSSAQHHFRCLSEVAAHVASSTNPQQRAARLLEIYDAAETAWAQAGPLARPLEADADAWITPYQEGFRAYVRDEGWGV